MAILLSSCSTAQPKPQNHTELPLPEQIEIKVHRDCIYQGKQQHCITEPDLSRLIKYTKRLKGQVDYYHSITQ